MNEPKQGQQIIFRHPKSGKIWAGVVLFRMAYYGYDSGSNSEYEYHASCPVEEIQEWCDAEDAFNAWGLQHDSDNSNQ